MRSAPRPRFLPLAGASIFSGLATLAVSVAHAQAPPGSEAAPPPVYLRPSPMLADELSPESKKGPTFVFGDRVSGQPEVRTSVQGQAELRRAATAIRADRIDLEESTQLVTTQGQVRIQTMGNLFLGTELQLRLDTFEGFFSQVDFRLRSGANGRAERIDFLGEQRMIAHRGAYTTCERDNDASWTPSWDFRAQRMHFDFDAGVGEAYRPVLRFKGVPFMAWGGSLSFPLSEKRKSGLLPPSYVLDTTSGFSLVTPYYLDIAPNRDATITPTLMSKRGLDLGAEFRYLEREYRGVLRTNFMPGDNLAGQDRWAYSLQHNSLLPATVAGGGLSYVLNLNRVSDDNYWRDFPRQQNKALVQRLLPSDVSLNWGRGPWTVGLRSLSWQTLQSPDSIIVPPYDRLPQLTTRYALLDVPLAGLGGVDWSVDTDFTRFQAQRIAASQINADRFVGRAQISRPMVWAAGYITPKVQLHATQYNFAQEWNGLNTAARTVPTFSLDGGLQFEREARFFGRDFVQTLEPRAFYVYTPYRNQSALPNYDSAENSFNFASLFLENSYIGNDRIADANLVTLGVTSRLLVPSTGAEALRLGVAQRVRFADQRVTLDGSVPPVNSDRLSDLLVGASVNWTPQWSMSLTTQINPQQGDSKRSAIGARYNPTPYRVVTASYKRQQAITSSDTGSQQIDVGWQWPINDLWGDRGQARAGEGLGGRRWYSVGRLNYSAIDGKLVDSVVGLEYDGCCWIARAVLQRSTRGLTTTNTQIMFQLEFVGFSRIGNNPLSTLRSNVPRYQVLREQVSMPSRFTNYE